MGFPLLIDLNSRQRENGTSVDLLHTMSTNDESTKQEWGLGQIAYI